MDCSLAELREERLRRLEEARVVTLGLLPSVRQGAWDKPAGLGHLGRLTMRLETDPRIRLVDLRGLDAYPDGVLFERAPTRPAIKRFQEEEVDVVLAAPMTYSEENTTALVARPVCLSPFVPIPCFVYMGTDEPVLPDGKRLTERLCGGWPLADMLRQVGLKFNDSYIPSSQPGDPVFNAGLDNMLGMARALKYVRDMRVLQIGPDCSTFGGIKADERAMLNYWGAQTDTAVTVGELSARMSELLASQPAWLADEVRALEARVDLSKARAQFHDIAERVLVMLYSILEFMEVYRCNAFTAQCWTQVLWETQTMMCFALGELSAMGVPESCETDKLGVISMALMMGAADAAPMFADFTTTQLIEGILAVLWWHCGPFPICHCRQGCTPGMRPGYILEPPSAGLISCPVGEIDGTLTSARLCQNGDSYEIVAMEGRIVEGPDNWGTHVWTTYPDWPKLEHKMHGAPVEHHWATVPTPPGTTGVAHVLRAAAPWMLAGFRPLEPDHDALTERIICRAARG